MFPFNSEREGNSFHQMLLTQLDIHKKKIWKLTIASNHMQKKKKIYWKWIIDLIVKGIPYPTSGCVAFLPWSQLVCPDTVATTISLSTNYPPKTRFSIQMDQGHGDRGKIRELSMFNDISIASLWASVRLHWGCKFSQLIMILIACNIPY